MFDFENFDKNSVSCTINNITVFELDCDFLILIFNEIVLGLHMWQNIKKHRRCGAT